MTPKSVAKQPECRVVMTDLGDRRRVQIEGPHMDRGVLRRRSDFEIMYSQALLEQIIALKGCKYLRDEISRDLDPTYVRAPLQNTILPVTALQGLAVLDFGSGGGASSINLCRMGATTVHGVDIDGGLVEMATARVKEYGLSDNISFHHVEDTTRLPLNDGFFDVVVCSAVLEHIRPRDRRAHLVELWRVLKPGGFLFIMGTPNRLWPVDSHTTGLPLIPYLPLRLARAVSVRFSSLVSEDDTIDDLLVKGIRGGSYWEIKKMLPDSVVIPNADIASHFAASSKEGDSNIKRWARQARVRGYTLLDKTVCRLFKIPVGAFYPYISLCFQKASLANQRKN